MSEARRSFFRDEALSKDAQRVVIKKITSLFHGYASRTFRKKGGVFHAWLSQDGKGVQVDNLGPKPLLSWGFFNQAIYIIWKCGDKTPKGQAMRCRLGEPALPLNSVEGWMAHSTGGMQIGDSVFRRIVPVIHILTAAGLIVNGRGYAGLPAWLRKFLHY